MARLLTAGAESNDFNATNTACVEFITNGVTADSTIFRSGSRSFKALTSGSGTTLPLAGFATGVTYYARIYLYVPSSLPTVNTFVAAFFNTVGSTWCGFQLNTTGTLSFVLFGGTVLATSATAINSGQWYRLEVGTNTSAVANSSYAEGLIDGVSLGSTSTMQSSAVTNYQFGLINHVNTGVVINFDDFALNDSTGNFQNTWPGSGKVVLLLPISDNAAGSWKAGSAASAAANGALFNALDNTPPVGTATPDAVTACISNTVSSATTPNGDFNLTTYKSAGIGPRDIINCMQMTVVHGEDASTGAKTGSFTMLSNPASANVDTIVQFGPAAGGAVGVYPTNWSVQKGTVLYSVAAADVTQSDSQSGIVMQGPGGNLAAGAQTVSFSGDRLITQFSFNMQKINSPTDLLTFSVQADVGGSPSGYSLYSTTFDTSTLTTSAAYYAFTFPPIFLPSGSILWFIIQRNILDTTNTISINLSGALSGNLYAGGDFWINLPGSGWIINNASRPGDAAFIMKASLPLSSVTLASSPVARITKTDTGTRAADCCFMGVYVDYTPALPKQSTFVNQSVNRVSTY